MFQKFHVLYLIYNMYYKIYLKLDVVKLQIQRYLSIHTIKKDLLLINYEFLYYI